MTTHVGGPVFVHHHVVTFEETNVVGNVYFARHVAWQGKCREMFLMSHAPSVIFDIYKKFRLVTIRVSCEYFLELQAFDEIRIEMRLAFLRGNRIGLDFDYRVKREGTWLQCARGEQEIGCMHLDAEGLRPVAPPPALANALAGYSPGS